MKKMKGVVSMEPPYEVYQDQRAMFRHQSLLQDYQDLHKETEAMKRKLQATKQKKLMLEDEVRFLRQRYKYLLKHPIPKPQPKQVVKPQKLKIHAPVISKGKNSNRKEPTRKEPMRPLLPSHLNPTGRISSVAEVPLQKTGHMFDLNQNARSSSKKDASSIHSSASPVLDLNHKERIHSSKEATKKSVTPFFDLNQISREEEELQGNSESVRIEEPKRSTQRVTGDDHDIKLAACRSVGDGANRTGKRKISWQDQVALRV